MDVDLLSLYQVQNATVLCLTFNILPYALILPYVFLKAPMTLFQFTKNDGNTCVQTSSTEPQLI